MTFSLFCIFTFLPSRYAPRPSSCWLARWRIMVNSPRSSRCPSQRSLRSPPPFRRTHLSSLTHLPTDHAFYPPTPSTRPRTFPCHFPRCSRGDLVCVARSTSTTEAVQSVGALTQMSSGTWHIAYQPEYSTIPAEGVAYSIVSLSPPPTSSLLCGSAAKDKSFVGI